MIPSNIFVFMSVIVMIVVLSILFGQRGGRYNMVPKKIWTFWDNPNNFPKSVKMCIESWRKYNPNYEITILNKKNYQGYINIPDEIRTHPHFNDSIQRFSDLVRLYVLEEHGGIWMDASILVKASFDDWLFPKYGEFAGYYMGSLTDNTKYPVIESWFLAANKNSKFIELWKKEFLEIGTFRDISSYLDSRIKLGINIEKIRDPHYLAIYVAVLKVLYDGYPLDGLILRDSEDGPFKYLKDSLWYPEKALELACVNASYQTPLMKMRSDERKILDDEIYNSLSNDKCNWLT